MEKSLVAYESSEEKKLAEYKCNTITAIELKLVHFPEGLQNDIRTFFLEYTHHLFGDNETAFGYKSLKILLYYIASSLSTMFHVEYASKVDKNFPFETFLHTYSGLSPIGAENFTFQIYKYLRSIIKDGDMLFATTGYMIVCNYYVQMLILTPFQGQGHSVQLLETVHRILHYISSSLFRLPCFSQEKLMQGFNEDMARKAQQKDLAKMRKCLRPEELTNQMNQIEISM
ncbi:unnamed protein product [Nyctereutes procyonoides]|uniref:Histone acetyltransferase type B catalytic subunit n=1 Tax=Nyctereutes procyonoides TaxID=34880 RepID=A0A811Z2J3_NYCPR|nr:unnamed protein product [Nyctereutes procyonoides]